MSREASLLLMIVLPLGGGLVCLLLRRFPRFCTRFSLAVFAAAFLCAIRLFERAPFAVLWDGGSGMPLLLADGLSKLACLGIAFFSLLIGLYSGGFFRGWERGGIYYGFLLLTESGAMGAALADNFVLLLCAWGFMGLAMYVLANLGGGDAASAAKKTMILVGGADALMVFGAALVCLFLRGHDHPFRAAMSGEPIAMTGWIHMVAYLSMVSAALAKAGAMPLHSWVPDWAEHAPLPTTAFLPASLDKLLGIYLLARISLFVFAMTPPVRLVLMVIGAATVVCAVMMAMVQHNMKRLLGYHAVSQVGYMVLGIGTGNPVGIAGGLFHMLNNCIYKTCLFLGAGAVEKKAGTAELDDLGGLGRVMPISFICCLVASLAISGIPPLNGFASKWMIYQGLIEMGGQGDRLWIVWLLAAMFGSVLTLASFVKLLNAIFLGRRSESLSRSGLKVGEVGMSMWVPMAALALLCLIFGVLALPVALKLFIAPAVAAPPQFPGLWDSMLATWLIVAGIALGLVVYFASRISPPRESAPFVGGEEESVEMALSGVDFYQTIKEMGFFRGVYRRAEEKAFDIYDQGRDAVLRVAQALRVLHSGILPVYLSWCLAGLLLLLWMFMK